MVDVGGKDVTDRIARASASVIMDRLTLKHIRDGEIEKGAVLGTARLAGIMAAKRTAELIPLCHPLALSKVSVDFAYASDQELVITSEVRVRGKTGVEMEALTACSIAALTVYDMCKSHDRGMTITDLHLVLKSSGKSGLHRPVPRKRATGPRKRTGT